MPATNTTIPAVKAKLLALFKAATEAEATEVWPARPEEEHQLAENVYLAETRGRRTFKTIAAGKGGREEDYTVGVDVEVYREGTDLEGTEARMWVIVEALENAVAERPTLEGATLVGWAIATSFSQETAAGTDGVLAKYQFGVEVTARI